MKKIKPKDAPLTVKLQGSKLVISIGIDALAYAFENGNDWYQDNYKVSDKKKFAQEVVRSLEHEEEDGTTMVYEMFDRAFNDALENGAEGIEENTDDESDDEES